MTHYRDLTKAQRWALADKLAEERLPQVNVASEPVHPSNNLYTRCGKRIIDVVVSGLVLVVTLPVNLVAAVATRVQLGEPIMFHSERAGRDGKSFTIVKFRNMTNEHDERGELLPASQRVTRFGHFMRRTSLDELLNFWSIFKGDMSLIGPRPLPPEYVHRYSDRHRMRLAVRPGLECPPRSLDRTVRTWDEQFENDVWYVEHVSLRTDLVMLANLVRFALDPKSTEARATMGRGTFVGYGLDGRAIKGDEVDPELVEEFLTWDGELNLRGRTL